MNNGVDLKNSELVTNQDRYEYRKAFKVGGEEKEVDNILSQLVGATITAAGFVPEVKEGGLAFDFIKGNKKFRVVFGYNEVGEWIQYHG